MADTTEQTTDGVVAVAVWSAMVGAVQRAAREIIADGYGEKCAFGRNCRGKTWPGMVWRFQDLGPSRTKLFRWNGSAVGICAPGILGNNKVVMAENIPRNSQRGSERKKRKTSEGGAGALGAP